MNRAETPAEALDFYHLWLGIPPADQPPNHYRLLGIPIFESDPRVIENAADSRMAILKNHATGPYTTLSQKLLNEVAKARVTLLNAEKKIHYDSTVRSLGIKPPPITRKPTSVQQQMPDLSFLELPEIRKGTRAPTEKLVHAPLMSSKFVIGSTGAAVITATTLAIGALLAGRSHSEHAESPAIAITDEHVKAPPAPSRPVEHTVNRNPIPEIAHPNISDDGKPASGERSADTHKDVNDEPSDEDIHLKKNDTEQNSFFIEQPQVVAPIPQPKSDPPKETSDAPSPEIQPQITLITQRELDAVKIQDTSKDTVIQNVSEEDLNRIVSIENVVQRAAELRNLHQRLLKTHRVGFCKRITEELAKLPVQRVLIQDCARQDLVVATKAYIHPVRSPPAGIRNPRVANAEMNRLKSERSSAIIVAAKHALRQNVYDETSEFLTKLRSQWGDERGSADVILKRLEKWKTLTPKYIELEEQLLTNPKGKNIEKQHAQLAVFAFEKADPIQGFRHLAEIHSHPLGDIARKALQSRDPEELQALRERINTMVKDGKPTSMMISAASYCNYLAWSNFSPQIQRQYEVPYTPDRSLPYPKNVYGFIPTNNSPPFVSSGQWSSEALGAGKRYVASGNESNERLTLPVDLNKIPREYDLVLECDVPNRSDSLCLVLCEETYQFSVLMNSRGNEISVMSQAAIEEIIGKGTTLRHGEQNTIVVSVRYSKLTVSINGKAVGSWSGDVRRLGMHNNWNVANRYSFGIGANRWRLAINSLAVRSPAENYEITDR